MALVVLRARHRHGALAKAPVQQLWLSQVDFADAAPGVIEHVAELQMQQVTRAGKPWQLASRVAAMSATMSDATMQDTAK